MRFASRIALGLLVGSLFVLGSAARHDASAEIINFTANLDVAQETTCGGLGSGSGTGTFEMDTDANTLTIHVEFSGLSTAEIAAHIHGFSGPGVPSGVLFGLPAGSPKDALWNFTEAQQPNIIAGSTYVNIHTTMCTGGEIRGQILQVVQAPAISQVGIVAFATILLAAGAILLRRRRRMKPAVV
jgi:hypothetical protein